MDGKLDEDMVPLPGENPVLRDYLRPGLRNKTVFHRRDKLKADTPFVQFILEPITGLGHREWGIPVQAVAVRGADGLPVSPRYELAREEDGLLQRLRPVVETREDMAVAICFHGCEVKKIMVNFTSDNQ